MDKEEQIKRLEFKIQDKLDGLSHRLDIYKSKIKGIDGASSNHGRFKIPEINSKFLIKCIGLFIVVFIILLVSKPSFIQEQITNKDTYLNEYRLSIPKLLLYTCVISLGIIVLISLGYYLYSMRS